jgi:hypothetical protein
MSTTNANLKESITVSATDVQDQTLPRFLTDLVDYIRSRDDETFDVYAPRRTETPTTQSGLVMVRATSPSYPDRLVVIFEADDLAVIEVDSLPTVEAREALVQDLVAKGLVQNLPDFEVDLADTDVDGTDQKNIVLTFSLNANENDSAEGSPSVETQGS